MSLCGPHHCRLRAAMWVGLLFAPIVITLIVLGKNQGAPGNSANRQPTLSFSPPTETSNTTSHQNQTDVSGSKEELADRKPVDLKNISTQERRKYSNASIAVFQSSPEEILQAVRDHLGNALAGVPASMYSIYKVSEVCRGVNLASDSAQTRVNLGYWTEEQAQESLNKYLPYGENCAELLKNVPDDQELHAWAHSLLEKAAEQNYPNALVVRDFEDIDSSVESYNKTAEHLEVAVRSGDLAAYQYAARFYSSGTFHHADGSDLNAVNFYKWSFLACTKNPDCDEKIGYAVYREILSTADLNIVAAFPKEFEEAVENSRVFGFADGFLPLHNYPENN